MENYRSLYKVAGKTGKSQGEKRETARREQKKKREDTFLERRKIEQEPSTSAAPSPSIASPKKETRREKLLRWKATKDKIIAEQKLNDKKRPPFKVGVAHHALDPVKGLVAPPIYTTAKCTTSKKAAAESYSIATAKHKAKQPSAAASSLALLAEPSAAPTSSAAFSGRVTRSRSAAVSAASKTAASKTAASKTAVSKTVVSKTAVSKTAGRTAASKTAASKAAAKPTASKTPLELKPTRNTKTSVSKSVKKLQETSFAPQNHQFKAPASLTLPTTPLALKRSAARYKETGWPSIAGVGLLSPSTAEPSPKVARRESTVASQRRGRLSRAVKERTPRQSIKTSKEGTPAKAPLLVKEATPAKTPPKVKEATPAKTPLKVKEATPAKTPPKVKEATPQDLPQVVDTIVASGSARKMRRLSRKSGGFVVTAMPVSTLSVTKEAAVSPSVEEATNVVDVSLTGSAGRPKRSMNSKKRQSLREKENVPDVNLAQVPSAEDSFSLSLPEEDELDSIVASSRRMSIHEPSPPVHVSPDMLANGMVPAQFSPFVTSARGKDKYSLQKRRSSLIPIVPEISPEELVNERQVEHFRNLLERESSRLLTLSALWEERKAEVPPIIHDKLLGPIGQARLLVKDKFQQFRSLVDKFESGDSDGKITADDLTGFWEMVMLTVENVDKRFQELEDLKANNWEEKLPQIIPKKTAPHAASKPAKPRTQSRIRDLIEADRKRKQAAKQNKSASVSSDTTTFDGGFFKVESPKKVLSSTKTITSSPIPKISKPVLSTPRQFHRRSLLQQVLTNSAVRVQNSPAASPLNKSLPLSVSPKVAAAQMRASELGRRMSMDSGNHTFSEPSSPVPKTEPTKSILKSAVRRSLRVNTPRNRVAFEVLNQTDNSSPGSPILVSPAGTPVSERIATPGNRKRASLIPRPVSTPKTGERVSLLPVRQSLVPSRPLSNGDLIDFDSPRRASRS
ncbi:guanylate kinase-associated protein mars isoform X2 [Thrips palmi]|uniref:Guanylate kinase-associated protein mars isoform X2 n=1 Tax=Thrips palmi TaxID=161013 RepID=A0A6P8ZJ00_THRPL|nr:guanylate kinase-associated protein mars isoform X2 [Thrips palmi]